MYYLLSTRFTRAPLPTGAQGTLSRATGRIGYRGRPVQRASRLAQLAKAGQVLCSRELVAALGCVGTGPPGTGPPQASLRASLAGRWLTGIFAG